LGRPTNPLPLGALRLDGVASNYLFASGFSDSGERRVIIDREAMLNLQLTPRSTLYRLQLTMIAPKPGMVAFYVMNSDKPELTVEIGPQAQVIGLSIPPATISAWRPISIRIRQQSPPDADAGAGPAITAAYLD
jgi:hypothetical protein